MNPHKTIPIASAPLPDIDGPDSPQRRRVLQVMAASMALAAGACTKAPDARIYPYVHMPEAGVNGEPAYYASAFVRDGYAHGVLVGTREGRPIKIEGNPRHPAGGGAADIFAQASVLELWDPDRSQFVVQRLPQAAAPAAPQAGVNLPASISTWDAFAAAWRGQAATLRLQGGRGLHVLLGPSTSPTRAAQLAQLAAAFPGARFHRHAPLDMAAASQGAQMAFGRPVRTLARLRQARLVVALACDPFSDGPGALRHAAEWAQQRSAALASGAPPCRMVAVETAPGLFGARADARLALPPAEAEAMLWRVAAQLMPVALVPGQGSPVATPASAATEPQGAAPRRTDAPAVPSAAIGRAESTGAFEARLARDLRAAGAAAVIFPGADLSPAAHALVHILHRHLGAFGRTVEAMSPADAGTDMAGDIAELASAIQAGQVETLLVLDANPVYDAPGALGLQHLLPRVPFSAHLGLYRDETAHACTWHLPCSHGYEAWSDARAEDGTTTLLQPAIAPLYDTRSVHEIIALLLGEDVRDGHAIVQRRWRDTLPLRDGESFDAAWQRSLRDGVVAGSAAVPLAVPSSIPMPAQPEAGAALSGPSADGVWRMPAVFAADASVACGRFANSGWLQELPRPFSKLTWDNAATLGPKTAAALGLRTGDVVRLQAQNSQQNRASAQVVPAHQAINSGVKADSVVEAPVWVEPLHAEGVVSLPLGYGRRQAGRVGSGIGFDAYRLRPIGGGMCEVTLQATGKRHDFATTQQRMNQEGRELARSVPLSAPRLEAPPERVSLYPPREYPDHAWAMTIDLDTCIGCNACTVACQSENNIPVVGAEQVAAGREMHWIRVDRYDDAGTHATIFQPVPCMHCENAPCEVVCPVGATVHDSDGLNVQVYNRCIGTRFCSNNCPYKVRRFNFFQYADEETESFKAMRNPEVTVRRRGVMEKCTFCVQRVAKARIASEKEGRALADGDVRTACQTACPTQAIRFGDLALADSEVSKSRASPRHYAMLEELNTRPRMTYLAKVVDDEGGGV